MRLYVGPCRVRFGPLGAKSCGAGRGCKEGLLGGVWWLSLAGRVSETFPPGVALAVSFLTGGGHLRLVLGDAFVMLAGFSAARVVLKIVRYQMFPPPALDAAG